MRGWLDKQMPWFAPHDGIPGRPAEFSDAAIQFCLTIKVLLKLPLRQTTGVVASLLTMTDLDWTVPEYTTLCRPLPGRRIRRMLPRRGKRGTGCPDPLPPCGWASQPARGQHRHRPAPVSSCWTMAGGRLASTVFKKQPYYLPGCDIYSNDGGQTSGKFHQFDGCDLAIPDRIGPGYARYAA